MTHHEKLLSDALRDVLIKAGVIRADADPTGPELLLLARTYVESGGDTEDEEESKKPMIKRLGRCERIQLSPHPYVKQILYFVYEAHDRLTDDNIGAFEEKKWDAFHEANPLSMDRENWTWGHFSSPLLDAHTRILYDAEKYKDIPLNQWIDASEDKWGKEFE